MFYCCSETFENFLNIWNYNFRFQRYPQYDFFLYVKLLYALNLVVFAYVLFCSVWLGCELFVSLSCNISHHFVCIFTHFVGIQSYTPWIGKYRVLMEINYRKMLMWKFIITFHLLDIAMFVRVSALNFQCYSALPTLYLDG